MESGIWEELGKGIQYDQNRFYKILKELIQKVLMGNFERQNVIVSKKMMRPAFAKEKHTHTEIILHAN